jgi:hypothetical protein
MPGQRGSGYLPEPLGDSMPCRPVSSLFHSAKRIERSVVTPGAFRMRASSITSAVPEPSSLAASP